MREDVIGFLSKKPEGMGLSEISQETGYDKDKLKSLMKDLQNSGIVVTEGKTRGLKYILIKSDDNNDTTIEEKEDHTESTDVLRSMIIQKETEQAENDKIDIQEIVQRGLEILKGSVGYYKLSFLKVLEAEFPLINKSIIRSAVDEIIDHDNIELKVMRLVCVG